MLSGICRHEKLKRFNPREETEKEISYLENKVFLMSTQALTYKYHSFFPVLRKYLDCSLPNGN